MSVAVPDVKLTTELVSLACEGMKLVRRLVLGSPSVLSLQGALASHRRRGPSSAGGLPFERGRLGSLGASGLSVGIRAMKLAIEVPSFGDEGMKLVRRVRSKGVCLRSLGSVLLSRKAWGPSLGDDPPFKRRRLGSLGASDRSVALQPTKLAIEVPSFGDEGMKLVRRVRSKGVCLRLLGSALPSHASRGPSFATSPTFEAA